VGDIDFFRDLRRIEVPVLLLSGIADNIARREDVERATMYIGARDREYRMLSRTNRYRRDYGHIDLLATPEAVHEVFPYIARWLEGRRSGRPLPVP
jgi:poly(3-hydroxyalkanoate) synthetase